MGETKLPANEEALRAAVGPRAEYYLRTWARMDSKDRKASWNWPACLLNVFWFAYRKMWTHAAVLGMIFVVASPFLDPARPAQFRVAAFGLVGLSFVTGAYGNHLYRGHAERLVANGREARGGVSPGGAIAALVLVILLGAGAGMLAMPR